jgi:hypothetical protein
MSRSLTKNNSFANFTSEVKMDKRCPHCGKTLEESKKPVINAKPTIYPPPRDLVFKLLEQRNNEIKIGTNPKDDWRYGH